MIVSKRLQVSHDLPPLLVRQMRKRRHPAFQAAIAQHPKNGAGKRLTQGRRNKGRCDTCTFGGLAVTGGAFVFEEFMSGFRRAFLL